MERSEGRLLTRLARRGVDLVITLALWSYYTIGFLVCFSPLYLAVYLVSGDRETSFQQLNNRFYRVFFFLVNRLIPRHKWHIDPDVPRIRSCVIVCNHVSYLDPLVLISLFPRHKTIAKASLFGIPLFGSMLRLSGYIPSSAEGTLKELIIRHMETMNDFLAAGGNLFVFPEGTRSRDGDVGRFNKGAFKIARLCKAPIKVLFVRNTETLFRPGTFLFDTFVPNTITLELVGTMEPDYESKDFSISEVMEQAHRLLSTEAARHQP
jgi:1-acyl-sn-glycerol-3-phosphate acyltransferase